MMQGNINPQELEKQKRIEERKKLMQPNLCKFVNKKKQEEKKDMFPPIDDKPNAGKVSSANVSESGGGEHFHMQPALNTVSPRHLKPVFSTIKEVSC